MDCCGGHTTNLILHVETDDIFESDYVLKLTHEQAIDLLAMMEMGECPVCSKWEPLKKSASGLITV